jgi:nucleoid-associated protein YgaU
VNRGGNFVEEQTMANDPNAGDSDFETGHSSTAPTPPPTEQRYTVKSGDSLSKIAKQFYGDASKWRRIYDANKDVIGGNPDLIHPGQEYRIPNE